MPELEKGDSVFIVPEGKSEDAFLHDSAKTRQTNPYYTSSDLNPEYIKEIK